MDSLEITDVERGPGTFVISLRGQFDFAHAAAARTAISRHVEEGARRVVVNLDGVEYVDSAGLGVLVGMLARARENGGDLCVVCQAPRIRRVFDITKLSQILSIHGTEAEAGVP